MRHALTWTLRRKDKDTVTALITSGPYPRTYMDAHTYARLFGAALKAQEPYTCLDVIIDSNGGSLQSAYGILDVLRHENVKTRILIDGHCSSAASIVAFGAETPVYITGRSSVFLHMPQADQASGMPSLIRRFLLRSHARFMARVYANATKRKLRDVLQWMRVGRRFTPQEAVDIGFCNKIIPRWIFDNNMPRDRPKGGKK